MFRDGLTNLLGSQADFEVVVATENPAVAIEHIRRSKPNIILLGWAASSPGSQKIFGSIQDAKVTTRVIMLTTDEGKDDFVEAVKQGCCGMVPKQTSTE